MANVLIVYATKEGQTGRIAEHMARTLRAAGHAVELFDADHPGNTLDLSAFRAVIVGAPIHAGGYARSVVRFCREHREFLERVPSAFVSVGLAIASRTSDGRAQTLEVVERFVEKCGWRPARVELVAGALPYSKYNFLIRFIMRRISAKEGGDTDTSRDYEYTDWNGVERFANEFVSRFESAAAPRTRAKLDGPREQILEEYPSMDAMSLAALGARDRNLDEEEKLIRANVRRFVHERYLPRAGELYEREEFPRDLVPELAELGLLGASIQGYGCPGMKPVAYGLVLEELEYGDSGLRSFVSVQGSLAMTAIAFFGSEAQKQKYLPEMAAGKLIGCFGLTEPDSGSDPGSMLTRARRDGAHWILHGTKTWITNAPIADVAVVWAKVDDGEAESVRGFVVERGTSGFETPRIHGKMSLRSSETGEIVLSECRVPADAALENKPGLGAPLRCLNEARFGISWGAIGAAKACFDCVQNYTQSRIQFGAPIAKKQLVQEKLVEMASEIIKAEELALHFGRIKQSDGRLIPEQVSLCKRNNVRMALECARTARSLLGANGILLEYPVIRHLLNLESVFTYEGTHEIHTLVLGKALTGENAF